MTNTTTNWYQLTKDMATLYFPVKEYTYNAYKNGTCTTFATDKEAHAFSKLVERVQSNKAEYDEQFNAYSAQQQLIHDTWMENLRNYFDQYSQEEFDIIYSYGYDKGHSAGNDESFIYMEEFSYYIDELKAIWNKTK